MSRLMTDTNSPTEQLRLATSGDETWPYEYLGLMRLDLIRSRFLTIPDSHLVDGAALLRHDPRTLIDDLRRGSGAGTSPVIVNARASTLDATLRELLVRRDDARRLNGFRFKTLENAEHSRAIALAISHTPPALLDQHMSGKSAADGLADFLADLAQGEGLDLDAPLDLMRRGWTAWVQASENGLIQVEKWTGKFDTASAARVTSHDPADFPTIYPHFEAIYRLFKQPRSFSSDLDEYMADLKSGASVAEAVEIERIEQWEKSVRRKALAMRHRSAYRSTIDETGPKRSLWDRLSSNHSQHFSIEYPESFIHRLGRLAPETFRDALNFADLDAWWTDRDADANSRVLGRVSDAVERNVDPRSHGVPRGLSLAHIDFTTLAATATATSTGAVIGSLVSGPGGAGLGAGIGASFAYPVEAAIRSFGSQARTRRKNVRLVTEYFDHTTTRAVSD